MPDFPTVEELAASLGRVAGPPISIPVVITGASTTLLAGPAGRRIWIDELMVSPQATMTAQLLSAAAPLTGTPTISIGANLLYSLNRYWTLVDGDALIWTQTSATTARGRLLYRLF